MPGLFTYKFESVGYTGTSSFSTGLFINGKFVDGVEKSTIEYVAYCI
jgi:aldehyde dehydrogenase (NAD+)